MFEELSLLVYRLIALCSSEPQRSSQGSWPVFCAKLDEGCHRQGVKRSRLWRHCKPVQIALWRSKHMPSDFINQSFQRSVLYFTISTISQTERRILDPSKLRLPVEKEEQYLKQGRLGDVRAHARTIWMSCCVASSCVGCLELLLYLLWVGLSCFNSVGLSLMRLASFGSIILQSWS